MNERLLIDMADGIINQAGFAKLALHRGDEGLADSHIEKMLNEVLELRRTLFLETHRSGEVK